MWEGAYSRLLQMGFPAAGLEMSSHITGAFPGRLVERSLEVVARTSHELRGSLAPVIGH